MKKQTPQFANALNQRNSKRNANRFTDVATGAPINPTLIICTACNQPIKVVACKRTICDPCLQRRVMLAALNRQHAAIKAQLAACDAGVCTTAFKPIKP